MKHYYSSLKQAIPTSKGQIQTWKLHDGKVLGWVAREDDSEHLLLQPKTCPDDNHTKIYGGNSDEKTCWPMMVILLGSPLKAEMWRFTHWSPATCYHDYVDWSYDLHVDKVAPGLASHSSLAHPLSLLTRSQTYPTWKSFCQPTLVSQSLEVKRGISYTYIYHHIQATSSVQPPVFITLPLPLSSLILQYVGLPNVKMEYLWHFKYVGLKFKFHISWTTSGRGTAMASPKVLTQMGRDQGGKNKWPCLSSGSQ